MLLRIKLYQLTLASFLCQGFSYAYVKPEKEQIEIVVNDDWPGVKGPMKINTVLQYDENYDEVFSWGAKALASEPSRRDRRNRNPNRPLPKPVELFKFYLGNVPESKRPKLPNEVAPDRAITDYLREMGNQPCFLNILLYLGFCLLY
jgi:hypothetical protein